MAKKVRPRKPVRKDFAVRLVKQNPKFHFVKDGDTWESLAAQYRMDETLIQHFNFGTAERTHLNWYLYHYVGCRKESADKRRYIFSSNDQHTGTGAIIIPGAQIGSARNKEPAEKKQQELQPLYERTCDVVGLRCLRPEAIEQHVKSYQNGKFTGGHSYFGSSGIYRGMLIKRRDGDRLVLGAGSTRVIFLMNNKVYEQDGWDFVADLAGDAFADAGRASRGIVILAKIEMALIGGFVSATGAIGFVAVTMTNITKFVAESDIRGLVKKLIALWAAKQVLEKTAPTLYDRLFSLSTLWAVIKETGRRLPGAIADISAEDAAGLLGAIVAKLGIKATETLLKQALEVAKGLLSFIATKVVPKTGGIVVGEYAQMAENLIAAARAMGVSISTVDGETIVKEIVTNQEQVTSTLTGLARDLE